MRSAQRTSAASRAPAAPGASPTSPASPAEAAGRACVVCGAPATTRTRELALAEYEIYRCACGLRTLDPEPAAETLVEVFDDGTIYDEAAGLGDELRERNARSLAEVERFVAPGRLLDVGCGLGNLLVAARERGWDAAGVDPSPYSVARAREMGFEAHRGLLGDLRLPAASFDAIAMLQVIEHLLDPRELLAECRRLLKPGGALLVETPNPASLLARVRREGFNYWIPPVHCVWYPPSTLARVLAASGLRPVSAGTWGARTKALHDGIDVVSSLRGVRRMPRRLHRSAGDAIAAAADALGLGSITQVIALSWEDA